MKSFRLWPVVAIFWFSVCCLMLVASPCVLAGERLVLVGGGKRPVQAVARFVEWAGGSQARIVIIPWASGEPQESYDALAKEINGHHPASVECAPFAPLTAESKARFLAQLKTAGGVFFTGGDQGRIMDVLADATLLAELRHRYTRGTVFGGTSAGTAIMSRIMLTGDGDFEVIDGSKVVTREGLGLLPNTIVDQHFIKRQRENRLFGLVLQHPEALGIGVDEDNALLVMENRYAEAVGPTQVMMVDGKARRGALTVYLVHSGEKFDLVKRQPIGFRVQGSGVEKRPNGIKKTKTSKTLNPEP